MKQLVEFWREYSLYIFALIGYAYSVYTAVILVIAVVKYFRKRRRERRSDEFYTRRNMEPPYNGNHPSGKGY